MIPENIAKRVEKRLKKDYTGRLFVYGKADKNDADGIRIQTDVLKYDGVPCRLARLEAASQRTGFSAAEGGIFPKMRDHYTLFTEKDILIEANDRAKVFFNGREYNGICGESHSYKTHTETLFRIEKLV